MTKEISLVNSVKMKLRKNVVIEVYPASLEVLSTVSPLIEKMEDTDDKQALSNQIDLMIDIVYELIKEDNNVKKVDLKSILTVQGAMEIIKTSVGSLLE